MPFSQLSTIFSKIDTKFDIYANLIKIRKDEAGTAMASTSR
jgi:hypothetical protein